MARRKQRLDNKSRRHNDIKSTPKSRDITVSCQVAEVHPRRD